MNPELIRLIESNEIQIHGDVEYFAELVAAAEREACAKVCDETEETCWETWDSMADPIDQGSAIGAAHCAAAIRARGDE